MCVCVCVCVCVRIHACVCVHVTVCIHVCAHTLAYQCICVANVIASVLTLTEHVQNEFSIPNVVNEIDHIRDWQELGIQLGLSTSDIDTISSYHQREYRQRLVELWFDQDLDCSWEKLVRAIDEVSSRRGSYSSVSSVPSTPTSPTGIVSI